MPPKKKNNRRKKNANVSTAAERAAVKKLTAMVEKETKALTQAGALEAKNLEGLSTLRTAIIKQKRATRRKVENSQVFRDLEGWLKRYLILDEDVPPLPSMFKEKCQVHNLEYNFSLKADQYRSPSGYFNFIFQPSFEKFLLVARPGTAQLTGKDDEEQSSTTHSVDTGQTPADRFLCSDKSWTMSNNSELTPVRANQLTYPPAFHWSDNRKSWVDGLKLYPVGSITSAGEPIIHFKSRAQSAITAQAFFNVYDVNQNHLLEISSAVTAVPAEAGVDLPFTAGQWANVQLQFPTSHYFSYGVKLFNGGGDIPAMDTDVHITMKMGNPHFTFGAPLVYETFSVLDVCCADGEGRLALEAQYKQASHIKFGLFDCTVKNGTANIAKSGFVASAQYPGNTNHSQVLMAPDVIFGILATMPVHSSGLMNFDHGQHYFYKPEKIQDWLYKQATDDEVHKNFILHDIPKIVTGIYAPDQVGFTAPIVNLTGFVHYELLTMDRSSLQIQAGGNTLNQLETLLAAMRAIPQFTENPSHLRTLGNAVVSVVKSPIFKKISTELLMMGAEMLFI